MPSAPTRVIYHQRVGKEYPRDRSAEQELAEFRRRCFRRVVENGEIVIQFSDEASGTRASRLGFGLRRALLVAARRLFNRLFVMYLRIALRASSR